MEYNEVLMDTIKWVFSGIGVFILGLFGKKIGVIKKLKAENNSQAFQADRDIHNNTYIYYNEPKDEYVTIPSEKSETDQEKLVAVKPSVEQKRSEPTEDDVSELIKLIIDSERNNNILKNYLSENIHGLIFDRLFLEPISQFPGKNNVPELQNARSPRVTSIEEVKDIIPQRPIHKDHKSIDIKFDLNILVNLYTRVHTTEFDTNDYSDTDNYSYSPEGTNDKLFNGKYWLKITGILSIKMNNKIFEIMNLSSLKNQGLKEKLKDMYTDSIIDIESIENRDAPNS